MGELVITIEVIDDEDFDGNPIELKQGTATLDGIPLNEIHIEDATISDAVLIDNYRAFLSEKGYEFV